MASFTVSMVETEISVRYQVLMVQLVDDNMPFILRGDGSGGIERGIGEADDEGRKRGVIVVVAAFV